MNRRPSRPRGHPGGLYPLFFTEMWERFSYYGMRALLVLFMVEGADGGGLGFDTPRASLIYGTYTMSVYMLSIPGGFIADNFLGARLSVLWGGVVIMLGHFTLAIPAHSTFYLGLVLIALGTGLLKPNISTMVGSLYTPGDPRRDAGFSMFYMGINLGAFTAPLVTGWLAQSTVCKEMLAAAGFNPLHSWHWGFAAAGVGMMFGLIVYLLSARRLAHVGHPPPPTARRPWTLLALVLLGAAALFGIVRLSDTDPRFAWLRYGYVAVPLLLILWFGIGPRTRAPAVSSSGQGRRPASADMDAGGERKRIAAILVFSLAALVFWAIFEQAGSTISLFADELTDRTLPNDGAVTVLGWTVRIGSPFPSAWFQSVNSLFVILLAPCFAWLWVRLGDRQPSAPVKFTLGLVFLGLSFLLMVPAASLTAAGRVSPWWIIGLFFLQTVGELCLSPVGLSTMTKLAPARLLGLVMGIWFLAAAMGNKLAGVLAGDFTSTDSHALARFFLEQALWVAVATVALLACVPWVKRLMGTVK
ncbi:MAG: peptide MFS transporter [Verrucomicrobia bacterium]|nr:peptide MFS transporter [Verrucomicrobiota bacterium]